MTKNIPQAIHGSGFLVNEKEPVKFIGSITSWIDKKSLLGWIKFKLVQNDKHIDFQMINGENLLTLDADLALRLAVLFLCFVAQNREFRKQLNRSNKEIEFNRKNVISCQVQCIYRANNTLLRNRKQIIEIQFPTDVKTIQICNGVLKLREEVMQQLGLQIINQVGILGAHTSLKMDKENKM